MAQVRQISVFVDNFPNRLAEVMKLLKENKVNIRALSLADTRDFGILRIIVNDSERAENALEKGGYAFKITEIVAITIPDSAGQLSRVLDILGQESVNIEYLYAFTGKSDKAVSFAVRVDDIEKASEVLTSNGVILLTDKDISEM